MRNELNNIEKIERYIRNEMSGDEKTAFEKELSANSKLQEELKLQQDVLKGLDNLSLKIKVRKAHRNYTIGKNGLKWGGILGGTLIVFAASYFAYKTFSGDTSKTAEVTYELPELNENGEKIWADADKYLPYQKFTINAQQDTVIETQDGIVMAVPANCFLDENGNPVKGEIKLEVKEAIETNDIMRAGLNTRSGNQLLETGGMFYINARKDEKSLTIDPKKGIYTEVPTDEIKPGMQLYEGKRLADGNIDWIKPKPLEKFLIPVDIHSLNFYPPNYEDTLSSLKGEKNKLYKDSLYYSYASLFDRSDVWEQDELKEVNYPVVMSGDKKILWDPVKNVKVSDYKYYCDPNEPHILLNRKDLKNNIKLSIFDDRYTVLCIYHETNGKNVMDSLTAKGYLVELPNKKVGDCIIKGDLVMGTKYFNRQIISDSIKVDTSSYFYGINPSKIKAIWDAKFNNTILATKEFEERLQIIHQTCRNEILDLYINNLDKKMCYIDSLAGKYDFGFYELWGRGDGRVQKDQKHLIKLRKYYQEKTKAYTQAVSKTEKEFWKKHSEESEKIINKEEEFSLKEKSRLEENYKKEFDMNLSNAKKQLGMDDKPSNNFTASISRTTYSANITNTGWCNIDRATEAATLSRTTLDFTDPLSGKKAIIKYEEIIASVKENKSYDRVFAYLIPDKLDSYMRMPYKDETYCEKLNELMDHQLVVIGYKGQQAYYNLVGDVKPGKYEAISLTAIDNNKLDNALNKLKGGSQKQKLVDELAFRFVENKEAARQKKVQSIVEFRERMQRVIFPCAMPTNATTMPSKSDISDLLK